jgi:hypothetical protein
VKQLGDLDFTLDPSDVCMSRSSGTDDMIAYITVEDRDFAEKLCGAINARSGSRPSDAPFHAMQIPPRLPHFPTSRRINCRKVMVAWNKPTRLVWLNFGNHEIAKRVSDKFNSEQYRIMFHAVTADRPTGGSRLRGKGRGNVQHNAVPWTVLLRGVPDWSKIEDVERAIRFDHDRPRHIEMGAVPWNYDSTATQAQVESLFTQFGPVKFTLRSESTTKRAKAIALFEHETHAWDAIRTLREQPQPFLAGQKLMLQLNSSAKFKAVNEIYSFVKNHLETLAKGWREQHLLHTSYPGDRFTTLKIEGPEAKHVAKAAEDVETLLRGRVIAIQGEPLRSPFLVSNAPVLKELESKFGVLLVQDKHKKTISYHGSDHNFEEVQAVLVEKAQNGSILSRVIELDTPSFQWACRGGYHAIKTALGEDQVTFDIVSNPKRLIVSGSLETYRLAQDLVKSKRSTEDGKMPVKDDGDCSICWTPADDPVTLVCSHIYCRDCFEGLCTSAFSSSGDGGVICQGDAGTCLRAIGLHELEEHLSSSAFEEVLHGSAQSYIERRPQSFRFCPSPDCGYVYRVGRGQLTCIKCLERICTNCHELHGTMSCADYKDLKSGGYEALEKFKKAMNIKDCPRCGTPVDKTEGCNHMACRCGAHFCWVCLAAFTSGRDTYGHLREVHGRIADGPLYEWIE